MIGGFGILKPPLLDLAPQGTLSYHHGDMRRYRGQPPAFWELYNGERSIGVTVQRLSPGIDCGQPIAERLFPIREDDTLRSLSNRIFAGSADMMIEAVRRLQEASFEPRPSRASGSCTRFRTSGSGSCFTRESGDACSRHGSVTEGSVGTRPRTGRPTLA